MSLSMSPTSLLSFYAVWVSLLIILLLYRLPEKLKDCSSFQRELNLLLISIGARRAFYLKKQSQVDRTSIAGADGGEVSDDDCADEGVLHLAASSPPSSPTFLIIIASFLQYYYYKWVLSRTLSPALAFSASEMSPSCSCSSMPRPELNLSTRRRVLQLSALICPSD